MYIVWLLFIGSVVVLPGTALLALRWALRHGEFNQLQKIALSIFDDEEPLGRMTDHFPGANPPTELPPATLSATPSGQKLPYGNSRSTLP